MAEFKEVVVQYERMCKHYVLTVGCDDCPLFRNGCDDGRMPVYPLDKLELYEKKVMDWAAEHPVVYPTWKEWLEEQRVVVHFDSVSEKGTKVKWELTNKSNCPIPADIAEKLGIKPKEG